MTTGGIKRRLFFISKIQIDSKHFKPDVVKRVRMKDDGTPFYLISLIEHKSDVDYNVVMQVYRCILLQLRDYSHAELMKKKDELSIVMMINKLHKAADFTTLAETVNEEYVRDITLRTPEYLLDIMAQVVEILLLRINVPKEEAADFAEQVKERRMGELFANFEAYDVQATRQEAREEGRKEGRKEGRRQAYEEGIEKLIQVCRNLGITRETLKNQLVEEYAISAEEAEAKIEKYW